MNETRLKKIQTIVFDYDGTLHDSTANYIAAFKMAYNYLIEKKKAVPRDWKDEEITKWLGYSSKDMWENFMPNLDVEHQTTASKIIGETLLEKILAKEATLYTGALETLGYLKGKGYQLIFLSNCSEKYMNAHRQAFQLDQYFEDMYCTETFEYSAKYKIFELIEKQYKENFLVVGDRIQDFEIGHYHNLINIGCNYGFGSEEELQQSDLRINAIQELQDIL